MAKALNTFLKSKMNKDLDSRLIPNGEYRNAANVQISRSEGSSVGSVENVLGNIKAFDFEAKTGVAGLYCIGYVTEDQNNTAYVFLTDYPLDTYNYKGDDNPSYKTTANNFIIACNAQNNQITVLVEGAFLNFSKTNPIYGVNLLENLLFWTDNRNQPRKINVDLANPTRKDNPTYYTTEDQISVAKYNPYRCMDLYKESVNTVETGKYETTLKDVVSKYYPNGGSGIVNQSIGATLTNTIQLSSYQGDIVTNDASSLYGSGAVVSYVDLVTGEIISIPNSEVESYTYVDTDPNNVYWQIVTTQDVFQNINFGTEIVLNSNEYYDPNFAGDPDYLEDKFSRFSYRFKFNDNEYSLIAPFTQVAFTPKQDGYFMYVKKDNLNEVDDQGDTYRSTVVSFMENKVNSIELFIPLPFKSYAIQDSLNLKEIDILYKESDSIAVKVVDTVSIEKINNSSGTFTVNGDVINSNTLVIDNLLGSVNVGSIVSGTGIVGQPKVVAYSPIDVNNPSTGGTIELDGEPQDLSNNVVLNVGEPDYYVYNYESKKPFKTLPEKDTTRVFDKIPVRSLAQEISGNRVIYANFQNKHTPPTSLDYNVAVSDKAEFQLNKNEATYNGGAGTIAPGQPIDIDLIPGSSFFPGSVLSSDTPGAIIPPNTLVSSTNNNGEGVFITGLHLAGGVVVAFTVQQTNGFIPVGAVVSGNGVTPGTTVISVVWLGNNTQGVTCSQSVTAVQNQPIYFGSTSQTEAVISLNNEVTFPGGAVNLDFETESDVASTTSIVEYPNSSLKTNRNYQVGVVLSDRYGRSSTVILSNNLKTINLPGSSFIGDTVYSSYKDKSSGYIPQEWPGNSIKLLFNQAISSSKNATKGTPGLYNGDPQDPNYNPLGWYSYKIVVKQTEQEYYNVYLPGIMASYPEDVSLEINKTSHIVLINDNINKVPRDLSEVGPQQRQFRSSVQLYGRVENTSTSITATNIGNSNTQYYPGRTSDTVSTISTVGDLFDYSPVGDDTPKPNYFPQFYSIDSNPLIAKISTTSKIGQISTTNYDTVTATVGVSSTSSIIRISNTAGETSTINTGDLVTGSGLPEDLRVGTGGYVPPQPSVTITSTGASTSTVIPVSASDATAANVTYLIQGSGVPEGTIILSKTTTTITVSNPVSFSTGQTFDLFRLATIDVEDKNGAPVNVTVSAGSSITITNDSLPGMQYLSVYETEPVESLLDIFWETSTSGLISDLNNAIVNSVEGGAKLSPWNPSNFNEGILVGEYILGSNISILDNFGSTVPDTNIDVPLELFSQKNTVTPIPEDVDFFTLVSLSGINLFNITVNQSYFDQIFFGENSELRNFTLTFRAVVNGQESFYEENLSLNNLLPVWLTPPDNTKFEKNNSDQFITELTFQNGSANTSPPSSALSKIFPENSVRIISEVNSSGNNTKYFKITGQQAPPNASRSIANLENAFPGVTPVDTYEIEVGIQDAGGEDSEQVRNFIVDFGVVIDSFKVLRRKTRRSALNVPLNAFAFPNPFVWQYVTVFEIKSGPAAALGWYLYNGPFEEPFNGYNTDSTSGRYFKNFWDTFDQGYPTTSPIGPLIPAMLDATFTTGGVSVNGRVITFDLQNINLPFPRAGSRLFKANTEAQVRLDWYNASRYTTYYPQGVDTDAIVDQETIFDDLDDYVFQVML